MRAGRCPPGGLEAHEDPSPRRSHRGQAPGPGREDQGGIIIPDTAKEKPVEGVVVATGSGKVLKSGKVRPLDVKKGDRVLFGKYSGTEIKVEGEEHVLLNEDDILAVLS